MRSYVVRNPVEILLADLKPGDEIIVTISKKDLPVRTVVAYAENLSVLTSDGLAFGPNVRELVVTGNHFETYEITPEVQAILDDKRDAHVSDSYWDNLGPDPLELL